MQSESIQINSLEELNNFAGRFAGQIKPQLFKQSLLIGLKGGLAAGKTTFTRLLVAALGSEEPVSSPSYVLENIYKTKDSINIRHWDLYRLRSDQMPEELYDRAKSHELIIVEWPERSNELHSMLEIELEFSLISENQRLIIIK